MYQFQNPYQNYGNNPYQAFQPSYPINYQQNNTSGLNGRYVNDFSEITANDVPMDGSHAMFMKKDGSEIQVRSWNANGQIVSASYKPIVETEKVEKVTSNAEKLKDDLLEELTGLFDDRFAKLEKIIKPTRAKKESVADE